jgi:hypothetical protein
MNETRVTNCPSCRGELEGLGQIPVRVGGSTGGWHLLLGEWADMTEHVLPLDVYRCRSCGRLEFYDHDFSLPHR